LTAFLGVDYPLKMPVGSTAPLTGTGYLLRMDDFRIRYYVGSHNPEEYISSVSLLDGDRELGRGHITVNNSLSLGGFQFFQMDYLAGAGAVTIVASRPSDGQTLGDYQLTIGQPLDVPALGGSLEVSQFFPDFRLTSDRVAVTFSQEFNNPAVELIVRRAGQPPSRQYVFTTGGFHAPANADLVFAMKDYTPTYRSGLKVVRNPGTPVICAGLGLLVAATFLSCYVSHRRIRAEVRGGPDGAELSLTGLYSRQPLDFQRELDRCLAAIADADSRRPG
jgi:cytochrome c biogenesis protein